MEFKSVSHTTLWQRLVLAPGHYVRSVIDDDGHNASAERVGAEMFGRMIFL